VQYQAAGHLTVSPANMPHSDLNSEQTPKSADDMVEAQRRLALYYNA